MKSLRLKFARSILTRVLSQPCDSRIPRSGEKGEAVNCYVTAIDRGAEPYLIIQGMRDDVLSCIEWDGKAYKLEKLIPLAALDLRELRITHYYGLSEVSYKGDLDYIFNRAVAWPYIKIHTVLFLSKFDQYLFNKKKLVTRQRKGLLKFLVNQAIDGNADYEILDLMTELHSIKWYSHPQGGESQRQLDFYLESLVETGELRKVDYKYRVTGKGLQAIEEYEEQERKHTESVKVQRWAFWVTVAIAGLTLVQAGLVKLPTFLDLSK